MFNIKKLGMLHILIILISILIITFFVYYYIFNTNYEYFECSKKSTSLLVEFYNFPSTKWFFISRAPTVIDSYLLATKDNTTVNLLSNEYLDTFIRHRKMFYYVKPFILEESDPMLPNGLWWAAFNTYDPGALFLFGIDKIKNPKTKVNRIKKAIQARLRQRHPFDSEQMTTFFKPRRRGGNRLKKISQGVWNSVNVFTMQRDYYAVVFRGFIKIETAGEYEFGINSDDAGELRINRKIIAHWYRGHGRGMRPTPGGTTGKIYLSKGYHRLNARFEEMFGGDSFSMSWKQPGDSNWSYVPHSQLYHNGPRQRLRIKRKAKFINKISTNDGIVQQNGFLGLAKDDAYKSAYFKLFFLSGQNVYKMNPETNINSPPFISENDTTGDNVINSNVLFKYQQNECIIYKSDDNYGAVSSNNSDLKLCYNEKTQALEFGDNTSSDVNTKIYFRKRRLNRFWHKWWDWYGDRNVQFWKNSEKNVLISDGSSYTGTSIAFRIRFAERYHRFFINNCMEFNLNTDVENCTKLMFELKNNIDLRWFIAYLTRINFGTTTIERSNMVLPSITGKETKVLIYKPDVLNENNETVEQWLETQETSEKEKYYLISAPM